MTGVDFATVRRTRILLIVFTALSAMPPYFHYRLVAPELESTRILGGLMPSEFLFLRFLGFLSVFIPFLFMFGLAWSWRRPDGAKPLCYRLIAVALFFTLGYLSYALIAITMVLMTRAT
jgi:hypothetical protein